MQKSDKKSVLRLDSEDVIAAGVPFVLSASPAAAYSGFRGKRDVERDRDRTVDHILGGAAGYAAIASLMGKKAIPAAAVAGGAIHGLSYIQGRAWGGLKQRRSKKKSVRNKRS